MPSDAQAGDRRRATVTQAADLFDRAGYHAVNVEQLARSVGLSKPALYHYFSGKDEILYWIHEEFIDLLLEKARSSPDGLDPATRLERIMGDIIDLMRTHRGHVRVFFEHHRELAPDRREIIREKRDEYTRLVQSLVQEGIDVGQFRSMNPALVTLAIFGMCNWSYQWFRIDGPLAPREIAALFWTLIFEGLSRPDDLGPVVA